MQRAEKKAATLLAIERAAAELFVRRGYVATTMREVAASSGVSLETVFKSVGSKRLLLRRVVRAASIGSQDSLLESPWLEAVVAETDPWARWDLLRGATSSTLAGALPLDRVVRAAASVDPEIADLWEEIQRERRRDIEVVLALLDDVGLLRRPLTEAVDVVWAIANSTAVFELLVVDRHWLPERAGAFVSELIEQAVLVERHRS